MSLDFLISEFDSFKKLIASNKFDDANKYLNKLKVALIDFDSLPPLSVDTPNAPAERKIARDIFEHAVILAINQGDKEAFQRSMTTLRPYYSQQRIPDSDMTQTVLGLNLLFLLVENRLADFHSELELLTDAQQNHPAITFCTQLDQYLVVGSYDQVLAAASKPPIALYSFFLGSLLDSVRLNIGECVSTSYSKLSIPAATKILMFSSDSETLDFVRNNYSDWHVEADQLLVRASKSAKADSIPSMKLISQNLSYATELERIV